MAYALGTVALVVAASTEASPSLAAIALSGVALGCSVSFNPLVGGVFALAYGGAIVVQAWRQPLVVAKHALAAVPVVVAMAWCISNQMVEGAGGFLQFGLLGASRQQPILMLFLSLGPILVTGSAGLLAVKALPLRSALPFAVLSLIALFLMYFVRLSVDQAWMAFRAGQMMIIGLGALTARFVAASMNGTRRIVAVNDRLHRTRQRPSDHRHRRIQRAGHDEPRDGTGISVDDRRHPATAASVRVDSAEHGGECRRADGCAFEGTLDVEQYSVVRGAEDVRWPADLAAQHSGVCGAFRSDQDDVRHEKSGRSREYRAKPSDRLRLRR